MIAPTIPVTTITKQEHYDEDQYLVIVANMLFNKKDRTRVQTYNKTLRTTGGTAEVTYVLSKECEPFGLGRLCPRGGLGLGNFRHDMRNPLAKKYYWDTDVQNCHWVIALQYMIDNNIGHETTLQYVQDRDRLLTLVSSNRAVAKTQFLKVLYMGDLHLYKELRSTNPDEGEITNEGATLLLKLEAEVKSLADRIWNEHDDDKVPGLHKMVEKKVKKEPYKNKYAVLMSILFQTVERDFLLAWDAFLETKGRHLDVLIHDGGMVRKLDGEIQFPTDLLKQGSQHLQERFKNPYIQLTEKAITFVSVPPPESPYEKMKAEFEQNHCLVGAMIYEHKEEGHERWISERDARSEFAPLKFEEVDADGKIKKIRFIQRWLEDNSRRYYRRIDFIPDTSRCPSDVFNLFTGFQAEKIEPPNPDASPEEILASVQPILRHLTHLTGEAWNPAGLGPYTRFVVTWLAHIIQHPDIKSQICPVFRDVDTFVRKGGGTGKTLFFDWFGNQILGSKYYISVETTADFYGPFNGHYEHKLLINLEEADAEANTKHFNSLKGKLTSQKTVVNKKNVQQYTVEDKSRVTASSNSPYPMHNNRRFVFFDTDKSIKNNRDYFKGLAESMANPQTQWAFFQYLQHFDLDSCVTPIDFAMAAPLTAATMEINLMGTTTVQRWLIHQLKEGTLTDGFAMDIYNMYLTWAEQSERGLKVSITLTKFGKILDQEGLCYKRTVQGRVKYIWNPDFLVASFKEQRYLDESFVYTPQVHGLVIPAGDGTDLESETTESYEEELVELVD